MYEFKDGLIYKNDLLMLPHNFNQTTFLDTLGVSPLDKLELAVSGVIDAGDSLEVWRVINSIRDTSIEKYTITGLSDRGKGEYGITLEVTGSGFNVRTISPYCVYTMEQVRIANSKAVYAELLSVENKNTKLTI